jgi:C-terminal processing protease CtpA/Prc
MAKYGLNYGYPDTFNLLLKDGTGNEYSRTIHAISVDSMRIQYQLKYGDEYVKAPSGRGIYLHKLNDSIHILKIKSFSSSILRKRYKQRFRKSIRDIFREREKTNPNKLLIDLRGNLGGESTNGNYLLSYLIKKPYNIVECTDMVRRKEGKHDRIIKNRGLRFRIKMAKKWNKSVFPGKIFMMIKGGSFSCSGIVASNLERYTDCQFIGQETGGNATRMSGAGETAKLPNTKIRMKIPVTRYTIRPESELTNHGVFPDFRIALNKSQLLSFEDEELKLAIDWLSKQ